jgi:hypothetical protein
MVHTTVHASWLNQVEQPFQWKFTTSDLDDLLARLDRHTADHQEESSAEPAT